jgi:geranylgeranyl diphosphate synthase type II
LLSNAYALVANIDGVSSVQQLISTMHQAVVKTLQGQMKDLSRNQSESITEGIAIAADKSGPLFSLSLQLPLILAGHEDYVDLAGETGSLFGVGYQIFDDIQDLSKDRCADNHFNLAQLVNEKGLSGISENRAEDLAHSYLAQALKSASKLPNGCANLLCENCVTLLAMLEKEAA